MYSEYFSQVLDGIQQSGTEGAPKDQEIKFQKVLESSYKKHLLMTRSPSLLSVSSGILAFYNFSSIHNI